MASRFWRWVTAVALLPWTIGASHAVWVALRSNKAGEFRMAAVTGAACWLLYQAFCPPTWWLYVAGHELTHALWAKIFGARVTRLRISSAGGRVTVSKANRWIVLSPYIFPFYTAMWVGFGGILRAFIDDNAPGRALFVFGIGFTYAFHMTFTAAALRREQPDIADSGWLFSAVFLYIGNALILVALLAIVDSGRARPRDLAWTLVDGAGWLVHWVLPRSWQ